MKIVVAYDKDDASDNYTIPTRLTTERGLGCHRCGNQTTNQNEEVDYESHKRRRLVQGVECQTILLSKRCGAKLDHWSDRMFLRDFCTEIRQIDVVDEWIAYLEIDCID